MAEGKQRNRIAKMLRQRYQDATEQYETQVSLAHRVRAGEYEVGDVADLGSQVVDAELGQLRVDPFEAVGLPLGDHDLGPVLAEVVGDPPPDPPARAGDDDDLVPHRVLICVAHGQRH